MARATFTPFLMVATLVWTSGGITRGVNLPVVTYELTDLAAVPPATLAAGAAAAEEAFFRTGIRLVRQSPGAGGARLRTKDGCAALLRVFILGERSFAAASPDPDAPGYTAVTAAGSPAAAMISSPRIERIAAHYRLSMAAVLGHVMAHELGHLVLGRRAHRQASVMKEAWGASELVQLAQGRLRFSHGEQRLMRARIDHHLFSPAGCDDGGIRSRVE